MRLAIADSLPTPRDSQEPESRMQPPHSRLVAAGPCWPAAQWVQPWLCSFASPSPLPAQPPSLPFAELESEWSPCLRMRRKERRRGEQRRTSPGSSGWRQPAGSAVEEMLREKRRWLTKDREREIKRRGGSITHRTSMQGSLWSCCCSVAVLRLTCHRPRILSLCIGAIIQIDFLTIVEQGLIGEHQEEEAAMGSQDFQRRKRSTTGRVGTVVSL